MLLPCCNATWSSLFRYKVTDTACDDTLCTPTPSSPYPNQTLWYRYQPIYVAPDIQLPGYNFRANISTPLLDSINLHILPIRAGIFPVPLSLVPDWYQICNSKTNQSRSERHSVPHPILDTLYIQQSSRRYYYLSFPDRDTKTWTLLNVSHLANDQAVSKPSFSR